MLEERGEGSQAGRDETPTLAWLVPKPRAVPTKAACFDTINAGVPGEGVVDGVCNAMGGR